MQACHAAVEYAGTYTLGDCTTLVMLVVPDEKTLQLLIRRLELYEIPYEDFREPDLGDSLTAVACAGPLAGRKLRKLPLMLRGGE